MKLIPFFGDGYAANSYLLIDDLTGEAVLLDASVSPDLLKATLSAEGASLCAVVLTHGHFDHMLQLAPITADTGAPVLIHVYDAPCLLDASRSEFQTFLGRNVTFPPADRLLTEGESVAFGQCRLQVLHTPGHTPGSCCFLTEDGTALFSGDTLFAGSVGRTDLTGGNSSALLVSLERLRTLSPETAVYPGHGPASTVSHELQDNPCLRGVLNDGF